MTTAVETPTPRAQFLAERTRIGTPRLKPYERLMTRFYEVLCLARAFSPARGDRTPPPLDRDEHQARRRRLLRNLAYICDFDKGGAACTAVALEDGETTYTFWIASNATGTPALDMVTAVLQFLAPTPASHDDDDDDARAAELLGMCTEFAAKRIKTERQFLQRTIAQIHKHLSRPGNMKDGGTHSSLQTLVTQG